EAPLADVLHREQRLIARERCPKPRFARGIPQRRALAVIDDALRLEHDAPAAHPRAIRQVDVFEVRRPIEGVESAELDEELPAKGRAASTGVERVDGPIDRQVPPLVVPAIPDGDAPLASRLLGSFPIEHSGGGTKYRGIRETDDERR